MDPCGRLDNECGAQSTPCRCRFRHRSIRGLRLALYVRCNRELPAILGREKPELWLLPTRVGRCCRQARVRRAAVAMRSCDTSCEFMREFYEASFRFFNNLYC